jgi:P pilus assembly chaperone PapD
MMIYMNTIVLTFSLLIEILILWMLFLVNRTLRLAAVKAEEVRIVLKKSANAAEMTAWDAGMLVDDVRFDRKSKDPVAAVQVENVRTDLGTNDAAQEVLPISRI